MTSSGRLCDDPPLGAPHPLGCTSCPLSYSPWVDFVSTSGLVSTLGQLPLIASTVCRVFFSYKITQRVSVSILGSAIMVMAADLTH